MKAYTLLLFTLFFSSIQGVLGCPSGWLSHNEKCYLLSSFTASWPSASSYCRALNSKLAEPMDQSTVTFLSGEVRGSPPLKDTQYYIGGGDFIVEGEWIWVSTQTPMVVTNWASGEPNDGQSHEDCVVIYMTGPWVDVSCDDPHGFICETGEEVAQGLVG